MAMKRINVITAIIVFLLTCIVYGHISKSEHDKDRYESGKSQYAVMKQQAKMPKFGQCWLSAIALTERTCSELTDESQTRLALEYLNCFLRIQGRDIYPCQPSQTIRECTVLMHDSDRASFTTFFTHSNNICFFLQSQAWHEHTEKTISRLADNSEDVADQLEVSSSLQKEMMLHQNTSISNQKLLIDQAHNLSQVLANSSVNIHDMFTEFNRTTLEQRHLIMDVFDRIAKLQSLVLGEFSGFYSLIFYFLSIIISYFLTSTQRTHSARFWLFGIMTLNILAERFIISMGQVADGGTAENMANESLVYSRQWLCREASCALGLAVLVVCAYRYTDINLINNHLLVEIRKQNSDLKKLLVSGHSPGRPATPLCDDRKITRTLSGSRSSTPVNSPASTLRDSLGYHSDSESDSDSQSSASDHTFICSDDHHGDLDTSDCDAYRTASRCSSRSTLSRSRSSTPAMMDELAALRETTPFKELISAVWNTGENATSDSATVSQPSSPSKFGHSVYRPGLERYNLRNRTVTPAFNNPVMRNESARQFSHTVHRMARVASKNSMLARFAKRRETSLGHSSDDDTRRA